MSQASSQLEDRILGALAGMAAGDALGLPFRGKSWRAVAEDAGPVSDFLPWHEAGRDSPEREAGSCSDIAALALALASRAGTAGRKPRASMLIDELRAHPGLQSLPAQAALARINAGMEPSRSAVPELAGPEALYLAVPVGIAYLGDPEAAFLAARSLVGPILLGASLEAGQVLAAAVAAALGPDGSTARCMEAALDLAPPSVMRMLNPASIFAREHLGHPPGYLLPGLSTQFSGKASNDPHGPSLESLIVGMVLMYVSDGAPDQSVTGAVSYGQWAHASGAVAGALSGSLAGASKLPDHWLQALTDANPGIHLARTATSLASVVMREADWQQRRVGHIRALQGDSVVCP